MLAVYVSSIRDCPVAAVLILYRLLSLKRLEHQLLNPLAVHGASVINLMDIDIQGNGGLLLNAHDSRMNQFVGGGA